MNQFSVNDHVQGKHTGLAGVIVGVYVSPEVFDMETGKGRSSVTYDIEWVDQLGISSVATGVQEGQVHRSVGPDHG